MQPFQLLKKFKLARYLSSMTKLGALAGLLSVSLSAHAQIAGAGSTLVRDLMTSWGASFASGALNYDAAGSSVGVSRSREAAVDFGVSDVPLTAAALQQGNMRQIPLVGASVAVIVNLPELAGRPIKLTGDILADIYMGGIREWNHSQIAGINPGLNLPARAIVPIWRSDGSGQSYVFTTYLARGNPKWRRSPGSTNNLTAPVGRGVRGGAAMIEAIKAAPGAIGFESLGAAQRAQLAVAQLRNAENQFVAPTAASVQAALSSARWDGANAADLDGSAGATTYPMTAVAYALLPSTRRNPQALAFLKASVSGGDAQAQQTGFVALPAAGKALVLQMQ